MHTFGISQTEFRELNVSEVECRNLAKELHVDNRCSARKALGVITDLFYVLNKVFLRRESTSPFLDLHQFCFSRKIGVCGAIKKKGISRISVRFQPKLVSLNDFNKLDDVKVCKNWPDYRLNRSCVQANRAANSE